MLHVNSYWFMSTEVAASPRAAKIQSQRNMTLETNHSDAWDTRCISFLKDNKVNWRCQQLTVMTTVNPLRQWLMFYVKSYCFMSKRNVSSPQRQRYRVSETWPIETSHYHTRDTSCISFFKDNKVNLIEDGDVVDLVDIQLMLYVNSKSVRSTVDVLCE